MIKALPILTKICLILSLCLLIIAALYIYISPLDYQQAILVKLLYLHVPCAWLSLFCYMCMSLFALLFILNNNNIFGAMLKVMAPIGANFTALTLICGSLWGAKAWGSWWVWDARLVSELLLLFIYLGIIALRNNFNEQHKADLACAILCLLGSINLPIIKFSIIWWNSLHQGASINLTNNNIHPLMLKALISSALALFCFMLTIFFLELRLELLDRANSLRKLKLMRIIYKNTIKAKI